MARNNGGIGVKATTLTRVLPHASRAPLRRVIRVTPASLVPVRPVIPGRLRLAHSVWQAAGVLVVVLRNALVCGFVATLVSFVLSRGNILSFEPPIAQSISSFTAGVEISTHLLITFSIIFVHSLELTKFAFVTKQGGKATTWWCFRLLLRRMCFLWFACGFIPITATYVIGMVSMVALTTYKVHLYIGATFIHAGFVCLELTRRHIFQAETLLGQQIGYVNSASFWKRFLKHQARHPGFYIAVWMSVGYLHCATTELATTNSTVFSAVSLLIKLALQEMAKREVLKRPSVHANTIYIVVMAPTFLISTQLRVVLIRSQGSTSWMILGSLGLLEIIVRVTRTAVVRWELRRHQSVRLKSRSQGSGTLPAVRGTLKRWTDRRLLFQAAEILAEMHAEYIAIACSIAIHSFLGGHPRYSLPRITLSTTISRDDPESAGNVPQITLLSLFAQLALAMLVDLISCIVEISYGVPLVASTEESSYLTPLLVHQTSAGVCMSAVAYISK